MNFENAKKIIKKMDSSLSENNDDFKVSVILLMSSDIGPNIKRLASVTPYSRKYISKISKRLRENGVWRGGRVYHSGWFDKETGGIGFFCDVGVGLGYLRKTCKQPQ